MVESTTTDDNLKITFVSSSDYTGYNSYFAPATGNKIIQVKVDFQNNGTSDEYLSGFECYADNAKCEDYFYADDTKSPTLESVSSGKSFSSIVYFEVPKNAEHITVEYTTNVLNSSKVILNVK